MSWCCCCNFTWNHVTHAPLPAKSELYCGTKKTFDSGMRCHDHPAIQFHQASLPCRDMAKQLHTKTKQGVEHQYTYIIHKYRNTYIYITIHIQIHTHIKYHVNIYIIYIDMYIYLLYTFAYWYSLIIWIPMYIYICMYIFTCTYTQTSTSIYTSTCTYTKTCKCMDTYIIIWGCAKYHLHMYDCFKTNFFALHADSKFFFPHCGRKLAQTSLPHRGQTTCSEQLLLRWNSSRDQTSCAEHTD